MARIFEQASDCEYGGGGDAGGGEGLLRFCFFGSGDGCLDDWDQDFKRLVGRLRGECRTEWSRGRWERGNWDGERDRFDD